jgi:transcriptional regulator with XRE-family HTH domain
MTTTPVEAPPLRERVAEEIRVLLARRRMSAAQLGRQLGVSQTYIWRRLKGETAFDLDDLDRIAGVLGVAPADLFPVDVLKARQTSIWKMSPPNGQTTRPRDNRPSGRADRNLSQSPPARRPRRIGNPTALTATRPAA